MRTATRPLILLLAALAIPAAAGSRVALADECHEGDHACAAKFFEAGRILLQAGDCAGAIPAFRASIAHQPSVGALLNLGDCESKTGAIASAYDRYEAAARLARQSDDPRSTAAQQSAAALEGRILRVRIVTPGAQAPVSVRIDGAPLPAADVTLAIEGHYALEAALDHTVSVTDAAGRTWERTIRGAAGAQLDVAPEVQQAPSAAAPLTTAAPPPSVPAPAPAEETGHGAGLRIAGLAIGGTGVAAVVVGTVMGLVALSKRNDAQAACTAGGGSYPGHCTGSDPSAVLGANDAARNAALASTIALAAGGVALAGGVVLYLAASPSPSPETGQGAMAASLTLGGAW